MSNKTDSRRDRWRSALALVAATALGVALVTVQSAQAAPHDIEVFELDENIVDDEGAGDDWESVYDSAPTVDDDDDASTPSSRDQHPNSAFASTFIADGNASTDDIFTLGSSKDYLDVSGWHYKSGSVPDKNQIMNAYAAGYEFGGDTYVYFGMDRFATEGSANVGFWFLQDGDFGKDGTGGFNGTHTVADPEVEGSHGDILVLSEFDGGGQHASIKIFEWVGTGGDEGGGALQTLSSSGSQNADCDETPASADFCANVNQETILDVDIPWDYESKKVKGKANPDIPVAAFFEGGVNLDAILGDTAPCISNFVAETRSSFETNAILKDVAVGSFELCGSLRWLKVGPDGVTPLAGATFEVCALNGSGDTDDECWDVKDNAISPTDPDAEEPGEGEKSDEDDDDGEFLLEDLQPGEYTIEETIAPEGYVLDDDVKQVTVTRSDVPSEPTVADGDDDGDARDPDPFVNSGKYKVIVLTCDMSDDSLVDSTVQLDVDGDEDLDEDSTATLTEDEDFTDAELCGLGGAVWEDLVPGTYSGTVEVPDVDPFFPDIE